MAAPPLEPSKSPELIPDGKSMDDGLTTRRILAAAATFVIVLMVAAQLDLSEAFVDWAAAHEDWEVDELPIALLSAAMAVVVLGMLERRRYRQEMRRRELIERRLREAADFAHSANATKTAFLAIISHEFRTPLNAIVGFSDIMQNEMLGKISPPQYAGYARDIHNSSTHLLSLVERVLDISKIEAGKYELQPRGVLAHRTGRRCRPRRSPIGIKEGAQTGECRPG